MSHFSLSNCREDDSRRGAIEHLRQQFGGHESGVFDDERFSSSIPALDHQLPGGGLRYGMLTEWLSEAAGSGAGTLSLLCAREACRPGGVLVVIDRQQNFYPPAAAAWGIDLGRLIVVRPQSVRDELWAAVQALRSPAVAAVWAPIDRLAPRAFRRLQLAAETGRTLGLLMRPITAQAQPSWADVRLSVEHGAESLKSGTRSKQPKNALLDPRLSTLDSLRPPASTLRLATVRILRTRAGRPGGSVILQIDDASHRVQEMKEHLQPSALHRLADSR